MLQEGNDTRALDCVSMARAARRALDCVAVAGAARRNGTRMAFEIGVQI